MHSLNSSATMNTWTKKNILHKINTEMWASFLNLSFKAKKSVLGFAKRILKLRQEESQRKLYCVNCEFKSANKKFSFSNQFSYYKSYYNVIAYFNKIDLVWSLLANDTARPEKMGSKVEPLKIILLLLPRLNVHPWIT